VSGGDVTPLISGDTRAASTVGAPHFERTSGQRMGMAEREDG
jgi:hypothetical protein